MSYDLKESVRRHREEGSDEDCEICKALKAADADEAHARAKNAKIRDGHLEALGKRSIMTLTALQQSAEFMHDYDLANATKMLLCRIDALKARKFKVRGWRI